VGLPDLAAIAASLWTGDVARKCLKSHLKAVYVIGQYYIPFFRRFCSHKNIASSNERQEEKLKSAFSSTNRPAPNTIKHTGEYAPSPYSRVLSFTRQNRTFNALRISKRNMAVVQSDNYDSGHGLILEPWKL
jgi:hypothetical protein